MSGSRGVKRCSQQVDEAEHDLQRDFGVTGFDMFGRIVAYTAPAADEQHGRRT